MLKSVTALFDIREVEENKGEGEGEGVEEREEEREEGMVRLLSKERRRR